MEMVWGNVLQEEEPAVGLYVSGPGCRPKCGGNPSRRNYLTAPAMLCPDTFSPAPRLAARLPLILVRDFIKTDNPNKRHGTSVYLEPTIVNRRTTGDHDGRALG